MAPTTCSATGSTSRCHTVAGGLDPLGAAPGRRGGDAGGERGGLVEPVVGEAHGVGDLVLLARSWGRGRAAGRPTRRAMSLARVQFTAPSCGAIIACTWPISPARSGIWPPKICSKGVPLKGLSAARRGCRSWDQITRTLVRTTLPCPMSEPTAVRLVALRETPLDVDEVLAAVDDDASGGLTLFVGRVRDHDGGRGRDRARLLRAPHRRSTGCGRSATPSPASTPSSAWPRCTAPGRSPSATRRSSSPSSAAHRGEAFDASRALIDQLKAEVPIWKHQVFADGDEEWVGTPVTRRDRPTAWHACRHGDPVVAGRRRSW